ncbi:hypothetical protein [Mongoliimonas terrestris]|uniref:hypothetical protein n=1 Tax=Mongoliimonas terrestris TaxID=1709001 RepID=UPI00111526D2|nr:hypothetical protein [Mongoliimonas terrestris]
MSIPFLQIFQKVPLNYNEGFNGYHVLALLGGEPLYPPLDAFSTNNYPPLSFHVVAALTPLFGDPIIAGRFLAAASLLVSGLNIAIVVFVLTRYRFAALLTPLVLLVYVGMWFNNYTAMNDPQWFGHALQTSGLAVFVTGRRLVPETGRLVLAVALLFLGGLVKHNLLVLPLALLIWLAIHDRRAALHFIAAGMVAVVVAAAVGWLLYGPSVFRSVFLHARVFDPQLMAHMMARHASAFAPFAVAMVALALLAWRDAGVQLVLLIYAVGLLVGVPALGGEGVNFNALFDVVLATCMGLMLFAALLATRLEPAGLGFGTAFSLSAALMAAPLLGGLTEANGAFKHWRWVGQREGEYLALIESLATTEGPVACHMLSMCLWAGKAFEVEVYNYGQKLKTGRVPSELLLERIRTGYYKRLQLQENFFEIGVVPENVEQAIRERYVVERSAPSLVLVPRP